MPEAVRGEASAGAQPETGAVPDVWTALRMVQSGAGLSLPGRPDTIAARHAAAPGGDN